MQVTSEHSDNFNLNDNVKRTEGPFADTIAQTVTHNTDVETARAVLTAQKNVVELLNDIRQSVDNLAKAQYALVTLSFFVCLSLFALVIVLSLAFL